MTLFAGSDYDPSRDDARLNSQVPGLVQARGDGVKCDKCKIEKDCSDFYRRGDGFQTWCKSCQNEVKRNTRNRTETPEQKRKHNLSSRYGITPEQYDAKLDEQGGLCAICREVPVRPVVDHNHETGGCRGILCHACNIALPAVENKAYLESALKYLEAHK